MSPAAIVPDADLLYQGDWSGSAPADDTSTETSAAVQPRGALTADCGSGYTGLSVALLGLAGLAIWAWRRGSSNTRCGRVWVKVQVRVGTRVSDVGVSHDML